MYKPSLFNTVHQLQSGEFALYNTFSGGLVQVEAPVVDLISAVTDPQRWREFLEVDGTSEAVEALVESGFLVDSSHDEFSEAWDWFKSHIGESDQILDIVSIVTMGCNLGCDYCFQGKVKPTLGMTPETVEQITAFSDAKMADGIETVRVRIMGGEALLNPDAVRGLLRNTRDSARRHGVAFDSQIISNGTLLKRRLIADLADNGLQSVRVSIHGPRDVHDASRPTRGGRGTFDRILDGITQVVDLVRVDLIVHFDPGESGSLDLLFEQLAERGLGPHNLGRIDITPIQPPEPNDAACVDACSNSSWTPELTREVMSARKQASERGFRSELDPDGTGCTLYRRNAFNFGPEGSVYQCIEAVGFAQSVVGHIARPGGINFVDYLDEETRGHCGDCTYFPSCGSGCRSFGLRRTGSLEAITCPGTFYEGFLDHYVRNQCGEQTEKTK